MGVSTESSFFELKRLPKSVTAAALALCFLPVIAHVLGFDLAASEAAFPVVHVIFEWSAFSIAMLTCVLAFANYTVKKDPATPLVGLALLGVGIFDAFHILVSAKVIVSPAPYVDVVSFSWMLSRMAMGAFCFLGIGYFLVSKDIKRRRGAGFLAVAGSFAVGFSLLVCYFVSISAWMPKTQFSGNFMARPWDVLPLVSFVLSAYVFYIFYRRHPSPFSFALLLSALPNVISEVCMAFGTGGLYDGSHNIAHFMKVLAYGLPFIGLCFDYITSHRKMSSIQKELRQSVERFDLAVAGSNEGLWDWDLTSGEVYIAPRFKQILGFESGEFANDFAAFLERIDARDRELVERKMQAHLKNRSPFDAECRVHKKDGSLGWFRMRGQALWNQEGQAVRISGSISDIDEMKRAHLQVEEERRRAEEASKAKSEFVANMSHEIRTPMNAIIGMAELLEQTSLDPVQTRYVETLKRSGDSLLNLINDILDFSKIEAGQLSLKNEPFSVEGVMDRVGEILSVPAQKKKIDLVFHIDPNMPTSFIGDAFRLRQVLLNLVGNAIKFTLEGGLISVHATASFQAGRDYELAFSVKDTGIGISEEHKEKIFESFTQAGAHVSEEYGGTGLGLAICSRIVSMMGGKISVESRLGEGSTFHFTAHMKINERSVADFAPVTTDLRGKRILVVDDVPVNRVILRETLTGCGAIVEEQSSGGEAYEKLLQHRENNLFFDLAILDGRMPGLDGFELARRIREERLPVDALLMLTSDERPQQIEKLKNVGVENYLVKPLRRGELLEGVQRAFADHLTIEHGPAQKIASEIQPLRLLLVDDNADNRMLILSYLKDLPYEIDVADDGTTALDKFFHYSYDLVLMDVRMKVMGGYEATRKIREWEIAKGRASTPILALTAYAMKKDVEEAKAAGFDGHLAKPIRRKPLLDEIHRLTQRENIFADELHEKTAEIDKILVEQLRDLVPEFIQNREQDLQKLQTALASGDFETIETVGHNMAGTAPGYGFIELGQIGEALEDAAEAKDAAQTAEVLARLEKAVSLLKMDLAA